MSQQESDPDILCMKYTFQIALIGIVGVLMALLMMLLGVAFVGIDKSSMAAILGIIYGAIGTMAGLVIGHTKGSTGKEKAQQQAMEAQKTLLSYQLPTNSESAEMLCWLPPGCLYFINRSSRRPLTQKREETFKGRSGSLCHDLDVLTLGIACIATQPKG